MYKNVITGRFTIMSFTEIGVRLRVEVVLKVTCRDIFKMRPCSFDGIEARGPPLSRTKIKHQSHPYYIQHRCQRQE